MPVEEILPPIEEIDPDSIPGTYATWADDNDDEEEEDDGIGDEILDDLAGADVEEDIFTSTENPNPN